MVFSEDEWSPTAPAVRNLTPDPGYPLARRVEVRFLDGPVDFIAESAASGSDPEKRGLTLVRPGRRTGAVLRSLYRQAEL
jgi:hypothetical protein